MSDVQSGASKGEAAFLGDALTVVFSFLSRPDSTPLDQRRRGEGFMLDHNGSPMMNPATDPSTNAFGSDANVNFEKWGEYWRKVHGERFVYVEDPNDDSLKHLQRYDQIHRLPSGPTNFMMPPYRAPVNDKGALFPTVIGHIADYRRPRWDGVAYLNFARSEDIPLVLGTPRVRFKILPEDLTIFRDIAPILAKQYIVKPSGTGGEAVALVETHVRRAGLEREEFQRLWLLQAGGIMASPDAARYVKRYVQLHNIGPRSPGQPLFHPQSSLIDGVTLMSFANMNDLESYVASSAMNVESDIMDDGQRELWAGLNYTVLNRIAEEVATSDDGMGSWSSSSAT